MLIHSKNSSSASGNTARDGVIQQYTLAMKNTKAPGLSIAYRLATNSSVARGKLALRTFEHHNFLPLNEHLHHIKLSTEQIKKKYPAEGEFLLEFDETESASWTLEVQIGERHYHTAGNAFSSDITVLSYSGNTGNDPIVQVLTDIQSHQEEFFKLRAHANLRTKTAFRRGLE